MKYTCLRCNKLFSQKSHYDNHNNRKRPCKIDTIDNNINDNLNEDSVEINNELVISPQLSTISPQLSTISPQLSSISYQSLTLTKLQCKYCFKSYARSDALTRHINEFCKTKQMIDEQNNNKDSKIINTFLVLIKRFHLYILLISHIRK